MVFVQLLRFYWVSYRPKILLRFFFPNGHSPIPLLPSNTHTAKCFLTYSKSCCRMPMITWYWSVTLRACKNFSNWWKCSTLFYFLVYPAWSLWAKLCLFCAWFAGCAHGSERKLALSSILVLSVFVRAVLSFLCSWACFAPMCLQLLASWQDSDCHMRGKRIEDGF